MNIDEATLWKILLVLATGFFTLVSWQTAAALGL
jgi:hypothetical protein